MRGEDGAFVGSSESFIAERPHNASASEEGPKIGMPVRVTERRTADWKTLGLSWLSAAAAFVGGYAVSLVNHAQSELQRSLGLLGFLVLGLVLSLTGLAIWILAGTLVQGLSPSRRSFLTVGGYLGLVVILTLPILGAWDWKAVVAWPLIVFGSFSCWAFDLCQA